MHTASGDSAVVVALARFRVALSRDYFVQAYFAQKITFWVANSWLVSWGR